MNTTPPEVKSLMTRTLTYPLLLAGVLTVISLFQVFYLRSVQSWVQHSDEVIVQGNRLERSLTRAETDLRGYWFSGQKTLLTSMQEKQGEYDTTLKTLIDLVQDNPYQTANLKHIDDLYLQWKTFSDQSLKFTLTPQKEKGNKEFFDTIQKFIAKSRERCNDFLAEEHSLQKQRARKAKNIASAFIFFIGSFSIVAGGFLAFFGRSALFRVSRTYNQALEQSRLTQDQLRKALDLRDEFLSIASHELKTPLTSLYLQLQMIDESFRRANSNIDLNLEKILPKIDIATKQTKQLGDLIDSLLDVSRVTTGKISLEKEEVDLALLVKEVALRFEEEAKRAKYTFNLHINKNIVGHWDRLRITQSLTNLISNSLKYGAGQPIDLFVSASSSLATIKVQDRGIGIEKKDQARIFDRFERAVSHQNISGLGLGLYIAQQFVVAHGGRIFVESEPKKGSTFTIELPLSAD